jgi:hypothetical protein
MIEPIPTTCPLCYQPLAKDGDRDYYCNHCKRTAPDILKHTPAFRIWTDGDRLLEYFIELPDGIAINAASRDYATLTIVYLDLTNYAPTIKMNRYLEYKHDLVHLKHRLDALLLLA